MYQTRNYEYICEHFEYKKLQIIYEENKVTIKN